MATDMTAEEAAKQLRVEAAASRSRALIDELHREPYWNSLAKEQEAYATLIEQLTNENQRLRERAEDLEAELANERGIKEQFKAALARQEELEAQLVQREEPIAESEGGCDDCGRPYASGGFPDLIITKDAWQRISSTGDDGGLLCPSCICQRLHDAGMSQVEGAFMSGPIKSVDPSLMHTIRWVENLRVQGHGWSCPDCGERRAQLTPPANTEGGET
jgi:hypothetical protein